MSQVAVTLEGDASKIHAGRKILFYHMKKN